MHIPTVRELVDGDGREVEYQADPELDALAQEVIDAHGQFADLDNVRIAFLWKAEGGVSGGRATLGKCEKMAGLKRHFAHCDFCVWLAADHCRALMKPAEKGQQTRAENAIRKHLAVRGFRPTEVRRVEAA